METGGNVEDCVCDLVEFAMTLCQKLQEVNKDAFNTFQLRVGIRYILNHLFSQFDYSYTALLCVV